MLRSLKEDAEKLVSVVQSSVLIRARYIIRQFRLSMRKERLSRYNKKRYMVLM